VSLRPHPLFALCCLGILSCTYSTAQQASGSEGTAPKIEVNVNRVLVPVVVRDTHGHTVDDLKKEDFAVFDNDKPRVVTGFTVEKHEATQTNAENSIPSFGPPSFPGTTPALPDRILVFLFDDLHMSVEDMAHAKQAGSRILAEALSGSDIAAVVSMSGKINSGLTRDRSKLLGAIASLQPVGLYRTDTAECGSIGYYQADLIENKHDGSAFQDAISKVAMCNPGINLEGGDMPMAQNLVEGNARRALTLGDQDIRTTYAVITEYVRRMAKLPGERTLILVSSGFLTLDSAAQTAESQLIDFAAQSNVTVSAIDARGVYTSELTASERGPAAGGPTPEYRRSEITSDESTMASIADGTGGTFFHNNNDLDSGFKAMTEAPEVVYLLELSLNNVKLDNSYHRLKVKVDRDGLNVQARHGYFLPKPEKQKK
jgi:VWFA-related protein